MSDSSEAGGAGGRLGATGAGWQPWMGVDPGSVGYVTVTRTDGTGPLRIESTPHTPWGAEAAAYIKRLMDAGGVTIPPLVNCAQSRQREPRTGETGILFFEEWTVYDSGRVDTSVSDEETARQIALDSGIDGDVASDGTLRLGSVIVSASGGWDHPAAGDLDARSRRIWSLVSDCWASLPAWARRAR